MKIIKDNEAFNALLVSNENKALEMLKDDEGNYLEEVQIDNVNYKIFQHLPDSLLTELTDERLPEDSNPPFTNNYAGFVIGSVDFRKRTIKRTNFYWWYFVGCVNFESSDFLNDVKFVSVNFFSDVNFSRANFSKASFSGAKFLSNGAYDKVDFLMLNLGKGLVLITPRLNRLLILNILSFLVMVILKKQYLRKVLVL